MSVSVFVLSKRRDYFELSKSRVNIPIMNIFIFTASKIMIEVMDPAKQFTRNSSCIWILSLTLMALLLCSRMFLLLETSKWQFF